jgi:toxin FitB
VTVYLLDENVLRELRPSGHVRVRRWAATVADADLRISVLTLFEKRRGAERLRKSDPDRAQTLIVALDRLEETYADRIVPIDAAVAAEWARLLGVKDKNQRDRALAATARIHGLVLVTRNIDDVRGCDVEVLNPFEARPEVERV